MNILRKLKRAFKQSEPPVIHDSYTVRTRYLTFADRGFQQDRLKWRNRFNRRSWD